MFSLADGIDEGVEEDMEDDFEQVLAEHIDGATQKRLDCIRIINFIDCYAGWVNTLTRGCSLSFVFILHSFLISKQIYLVLYNALHVLIYLGWCFDHSCSKIFWLSFRVYENGVYVFYFPLMVIGDFLDELKNHMPRKYWILSGVTIFYFVIKQ